MQNMNDSELLDTLEDFMVNQCGEDDLESLTRLEAIGYLEHISTLLAKRAKGK